MPFLGLCLGHQMLATALGGECAKAKLPEIGVRSVQLTEIDATGVIFDELPDVFQACSGITPKLQKCLLAPAVCRLDLIAPFRR